MADGNRVQPLGPVVIQPDGWAPPVGYANGMLSRSGTLYVGGQIGWNADQIFDSHDFVDQCRQALSNVVAVVEQAGGQVSDIVRLTWYVTAKEQYLDRRRDLGEAYRRVMGHHYPAMTMVEVTALVEDEALVEIEATAEIDTVRLDGADSDPTRA
jgi:enamine deaminase RidA (YjgF/YER057c/UK114 family)